jgi:hypothetical protein
MVRRRRPAGLPRVFFFAVLSLGALVACGGSRPPVAPTVAVPVQPTGPGSTAVATDAARGAEGRAEGDRVDVEWQGTWWPAVLLERRGGEWLIHYENYGSEWDEVVSEERIRKRGAETLDERRDDEVDIADPADP